MNKVSQISIVGVHVESLFLNKQCRNYLPMKEIQMKNINKLRIRNDLPSIKVSSANTMAGSPRFELQNARYQKREIYRTIA